MERAPSPPRATGFQGEGPSTGSAHRAAQPDLSPGGVGKKQHSAVYAPQGLRGPILPEGGAGGFGVPPSGSDKGGVTAGHTHDEQTTSQRPKSEAKEGQAGRAVGPTGAEGVQAGEKHAGEGRVEQGHPKSPLGAGQGWYGEQVTAGGHPDPGSQEPACRMTLGEVLPRDVLAPGDRDRPLDRADAEELARAHHKLYGTPQGEVREKVLRGEQLNAQPAPKGTGPVISKQAEEATEGRAQAAARAHKGQQGRGPKPKLITVEDVLKQVAHDKIGTPIAPSDAAAIQAVEAAAAAAGGGGKRQEASAEHGPASPGAEAAAMAERNVKVGVVVPTTGGWAVEVTKAPFASPYTVGDALQRVGELHLGEGVPVTREMAVEVQKAEAHAAPSGAVEKGGVAAHLQAAADKNLAAQAARAAAATPTPGGRMGA